MTGPGASAISHPRSTRYATFRAIDPGKAAQDQEDGLSLLASLADLGLESEKPVIRSEKSAGRTHFWEFVDLTWAPNREADLAGYRV